MTTRQISPNLPLIVTIVALIDVYIFLALRKSINKLKYKNTLKIIYITAVLISYLGLFFLIDNHANQPLNASHYKNLGIGYFFSFFAFRLVLLITFLAEDILRGLKLILSSVQSIFSSKKAEVKVPGRRNFIRQTGLVLAAIPFSTMFYGVTKGKYNFKVKKVKLQFDNLPASFNGFKIVQISDIHSGSFGDKEIIKEGIELINQQNADLVLFTGDLVNNDAREVEPFISNFKQIKSKEGVYSVLGNHDYGDYKSWNSLQEKEENHQMLHQFHKDMNFKLLNNENIVISKGNDKIGLYGVENWGKKPFPQRGDLDRALKGSEDLPFKVLMSHDPTHWDKIVKNHPVNFDLTLAGHTHGMQFGVEIPGFKWSPVKYIYPHWAGLYQEAKQYLYVNRGFGFIGYPGRAGIWPEITLIELESKSA